MRHCRQELDRSHTCRDTPLGLRKQKTTQESFSALFNACSPCTMTAVDWAAHPPCLSSLKRHLGGRTSRRSLSSPWCRTHVLEDLTTESGDHAELLQRNFCLRMWASLGCQKQSSRCPESCTYTVPWIHSRVAPGEKPNPWPEKLLRHLYSRATHRCAGHGAYPGPESPQSPQGTVQRLPIRALSTELQAVLKPKPGKARCCSGLFQLPP